MVREINRQWKYDDFVRLLANNNYFLIRQSKHMIFSNGKNNIAIPKVKPNQMVIRRLIKENDLILN